MWEAAKIVLERRWLAFCSKVHYFIIIIKSALFHVIWLSCLNEPSENRPPFTFNWANKNDTKKCLGWLEYQTWFLTLYKVSDNAYVYIYIYTYIISVGKSFGLSTLTEKQTGTLSQRSKKLFVRLPTLTISHMASRKWSTWMRSKKTKVSRAPGISWHSYG